METIGRLPREVEGRGRPAPAMAMTGRYYCRPTGLKGGRWQALLQALEGERARRLARGRRPSGVVADGPG